MTNSPLFSISPIDGRYQSKTSSLRPYFSEFGLIKYRVRVEVEYFIFLVDAGLSPLADFPKDKYAELRNLYLDFSEQDAIWIKEKEKITNHDVKAVEYFIKSKLEQLNLSKYLEFVHFGLTSQDINNTAIPLSLKEGLEDVFYPALNELIQKLKEFELEWKEVSMLARTHGQPASPTRLGKEIGVFVERLEKQVLLMNNIPYSSKFGGATGNLNAHHVAFPQYDWKALANDFVTQRLGIFRSQTTTQIEHYDNIAALFDGLKRINTIILDMDRDMWTYISMEYFKQKIIKGEIGSSAMPHKVNPIDFENSEGNIGIANALYNHLSMKLPVSRLQRDLTDSTVLRVIGVPLAHSLIAISSSLKGLNKLLLNEQALNDDLEDNWAVVAEAIQSVLRREGYEKPYEALKELTRKNTKMTKSSVHEFIDTLHVSEEIKTELKKITPHNYTGIH